jgi:hypothetical protein
VLVPFEGMACADVAPGQEDRPVLMVAGGIEYVAKVDGLAQTHLDSLDERGIRLPAAGHR